MKHHLLLIALLSIQLTHAQEKPIRKPSYVVIINDEISSKEKIDLYASQGYLKKMTKGATWCAPCLMEFYEIPSKILEPFENSEFVFLPISKGESLEKVTRKMSRLKKDGIDFNAGIDPDEQISNRYAAGAIPKNILIDKHGIIRYISTGYGEGSLDKLALEIDNLLKKAN